MDNNDPISSLAGKLKVELCLAGENRGELLPLNAPGNVPTLGVDEYAVLRIRNESSQVLNVTVLAIQPDWSISQIHPDGSQQPNPSETSNSVDEATTPDQKIVDPTPQPRTEPTQLDVEFVNPNILISRQTPREMSGSKVKRLRKKIREKGFDSEQPIEVTDVDGKLIILDGHHRAAAAKQLRLQSVPIRRQEVSRSQAEQLLQEAAEAAIYRQY